jgi:hypothetical protein
MVALATPYARKHVRMATRIMAEAYSNSALADRRENSAKPM